MLIRARKHGFLDFEGEMLWQRQDDDVKIYLLVDIDDAKKKLDVWYFWHDLTTKFTFQ